MTPYFHSIAEFLDMGGHGGYVWASFGITFLCVIGIIVYSKIQRNAAAKEIITQNARHQQRNPQNARRNTQPKKSIIPTDRPPSTEKLPNL